MYRLLLKKNIPLETVGSFDIQVDRNILYSLLYCIKKKLNPGFRDSFLIPYVNKNIIMGSRINTYIARGDSFQHPGIAVAEKYAATYARYFLTEKSHNIYKFEFMSDLLKFKNKNFFIYTQSIIKKNIKKIFLLILNLGYGDRAFYIAPCLQLNDEILVFNNYGLKKNPRRRIIKNKPLGIKSDLTVILDLYESFGKISFYRSLHTPIIAITDHYTNPSAVDYPILVDKVDFFTKYFVFSTLINLFLVGKSLKNKYYRSTYIRVKNLSFLNRAAARRVLKVLLYNWVNSFFLLNKNLSQKYIFWLVDRVGPGKLKKNSKKPIFYINTLKILVAAGLYSVNTKFKGYNYLLDLFIRFSPYSMKIIRRDFMGKNWLNLPCFANIAAVPRFRDYRGGVITVGNRDQLPINVTYSGIALPFLIRFNKTPLWLPHWYAFTLQNYPFGENSKQKHFRSLNKSNLIVNNIPSVGQLALSRTRRLSGAGRSLMACSGVFKKLYKVNLTAPNSTSRRDGTNINNFPDFLRGYNYKNNFNYSTPGMRPKPKNINIKIRQRIHLKWYRSNYNFLFYKRFRNKKLNKIFAQSFGGSFITQKITTELNIVNILLRAHFIYFYTDALRSIQMNWVTVNGRIVSDPAYTCTEFDRIGFIISNEYFAYFRGIFSSSISKEYRASFYQYTSANLRTKRFKTPKTRNPKWPRKILWEREDIPKYLEVDFLTMTAVVVYKPRYSIDFFAYFNKYHNLPTRRMFNWKYLY